MKLRFAASHWMRAARQPGRERKFMERARAVTWFAALLLSATGLVAAAPALAHEGQPVQVQIREQEPGVFLVQWRVPKVLPIDAMPALVLPDHCRAEGERVVLEQAGGWLNRQLYRCSEPLAGQVIRIRYPLYNPSLTTLVRIDFLSGERLAHVLNSTEDSWRLPEGSAGTLALLGRLQRSVLGGVSHVFGHGVHLAFLLAICMLGGSLSIRLATAFAAGQLAAIALAAGIGFRPEPRVAEICVAIAVAFLAAEAFRPSREGRQLSALAAGAGLFHGLGLAAVLQTGQATGSDWLYLLLVVLGMDAALLLLAATVTGLGELAARRWPARPLRRALTYGIGGVGVALALMLAFEGDAAEAAEKSFAPQLPGMASLAARSGLQSSRRVAPASPEAPIQSYLAVEPYEVRHQVLVRLADVTREIGLDAAGAEPIEIEAQEEVGRRVAQLVTGHTVVTVDGEVPEPIIDRVSFMMAGARGVLPRPAPVSEALDGALVGVTVAYLTSGMPREVTLTWESFFGEAQAIPATVTDPETSRSADLTPGEPTLRWENALTEDPIPTVAAVAVEPPKLPLPLASLPLLAAALVLGVAALRGWRSAISFPLARVTLALAIILVPFADVTVALPASVRSVPSEFGARRILAGVLPNVYRAFELRDESAAYDRLAVSVTGETLTEVYLEHRRALEMEERGGARARVDAIEVLEVGQVEPGPQDGFTADASWTVGGTVTHFGHRHFRQNRYQARVQLVPVDGVWKIRSIDILDEERLR
ncbi:MAG: HupE/UreJ family protein [Gemmatimonadetes bacterium]|nr:HupE/UreJ family protein [Gemmatimonadota bacterium]